MVLGWEKESPRGWEWKVYKETACTAALLDPYSSDLKVRGIWKGLNAKPLQCRQRGQGLIIMRRPVYSRPRLKEVKAMVNKLTGLGVLGLI